MPGMDGLETSRIIKRGGRLKHVPKIVMVTASSSRKTSAHKPKRLGLKVICSSRLRLRRFMTRWWSCSALPGREPEPIAEAGKPLPVLTELSV